MTNRFAELAAIYDGFGEHERAAHLRSLARLVPQPSHELWALHDADVVLVQAQEQCGEPLKFSADQVGYRILEGARRSLRDKLHAYLTREAKSL